MCAALSSAISKASAPTSLLPCLRIYLILFVFTPISAQLTWRTWWHFAYPGGLGFLNDSHFYWCSVSVTGDGINPRGASRKSNLLPSLVHIFVTVLAMLASFLLQDTASLCPHLFTPEHHGLIFLPPTPQHFFQTCFSLSQFSHSSCVLAPFAITQIHPHRIWFRSVREALLCRFQVVFITSCSCQSHFSSKVNFSLPLPKVLALNQ